MADTERLRVVMMGATDVGKTAILKQFLFRAFPERYVPTVEDLYHQEFDLGPLTVKVDFLDTAGHFEFPAMRRLYMGSASGFILVYSVNSEQSFRVVIQCFQEILDQREDASDIPIIVVGNKADHNNSSRSVFKEDVLRWVFFNVPGLQVTVLDSSAKDDFNISEIFRSLLKLSQLPKIGETSNLRRQSSARNAGRSSSTLGRDRQNTLALPGTSSAGAVGGSKEEKNKDSKGKAKPRSRSLIRRSSHKVKQQLRHTNADDCRIS